MSREFEPLIPLVVCNGSPYGALNLAGLNRRRLPASCRPLRITCSGEISPGFMLKAFESGADGLLILACPKDRCRYEKGNVQAMETVEKTKAVLEFLGIAGSRLRMDLVGVGEDELLAEILWDFDASIRSLGPSPSRRKAREGREAI
jgi:F420-non-reducing hydrogenase iron-sulfur subunit